MNEQMAAKVNLLGLHHQAMIAFFATLGEKPYRAIQVLKWIHAIGTQDFHQMTDLSKALRQKLTERAEIKLPEIAYENRAFDGTHKWLLRLSDGNCIETVFITEKTRGTLCVSSQVGCILNCDFCSTGKQGFSRNLTTTEIIAQLWLAIRKLSKNNGVHDHAVTNVVMMGMGEPLLNLDHVVPALHLMLDDHAYGLSKRRVTVSTAGVVPALYQLRAVSDVALAISLHAPNDELRDQLVPLNKKYPLKELITACREYFKHDERSSITMEYVMLDGINDKQEHAKQLIKLLNGIRVKMNLIPSNPFPHTAYKRSNNKAIFLFRDTLLKAGLHTTIRRTRGEDINAACGQLVGEVKDRTHRQARYRLSVSMLQTTKKNIGENTITS